MAAQVIHVEPGEVTTHISAGLFGMLVEPYGRTEHAIWVGEDSPIPNDGGLRLDTIEAFRQIRTPVFRWPGGSYADAYDWQVGVGPRSERPRTWNYFGGEETNQFGTDEFLRFCELIGAEAWIKLNPLTADLGDALKWMQYCNYPGDSYLTQLRARNGHPEPYGVKYWSLGNEGNDAFSPEAYAELVHQWTFYMRQADPKGQIVVTGLGIGDWNERFLERYSDLLRSGGIATKGMIHLLGLKYSNDEQIRLSAELLDDYLGPGEVGLALEEWRSMSGDLPIPPDIRALPIHEGVIKISMDISAGKLDPRIFEGRVKLDAGLRTARRLHGLIRTADRVKLATFLYPTNTWGPLVRSEGAQLIRTPNYHVHDLLQDHMDAESVGVDLTDPDVLDVTASRSSDGRTVFLSLVNPAENEPVDLTVRLASGSYGSRAKVRVLGGDPSDENTLEEPDSVVPHTTTIEGQGGEWSLVCEPHSVTVLTFGDGG